MRVHHINTATMCPVVTKLIKEKTPPFTPREMVAHCLLVETEQGLVLVDTGLGLEDIANPGRRLGKFFQFLTGPKLLQEETAARQVERLGYRRQDVRHIVLTHLDTDHAGGLADFPHARVHLHATEHQAALHPKTLPERGRYRAVLWSHGPEWRPYTPSGEKWFGFDCVRSLDGLPPEILIIPLFGHSRGHSGVAVNAGGRWLLHAGDSYFFHGEVNPDQPECPRGLRLFQSAVQIDKAARLQNQQRLRELMRDHRDEVEVFSAHDPHELQRYASAATPDERAAG